MVSYRNIKNVLVSLLFFALNQISFAQFTQGNLVVLQVGDGTTALSSAAAPTFLKEFTTIGGAGISVVIPTAGSGRLTMSGSATSEGLITRSSDLQYILVPGYDAAVSTAAIASTANPPTNRVIDTVNFNAGVNRAATSATVFSANNCRGVASDGNNNYWVSGANTGVCYFGAGTPAIVSSSVTNLRSINIFNNKLYFSTGSGTHGIYVVGAGTPPINSGNTSTLLINTGGSPYQFALNATADICYIADDQASASGGIQKWILNSGIWSLAYTLGTGVSNIGARGLCVDWSGANPILYATSAEASSNRLFKIIDAGSSSSATTLATASSNTIFRGVTLSPYCAAPSVNLMTSNGSICANQSLNLSVNASGANPLSYVWNGTGSFSSTSVQSPTVTSASSGTYSVSITNKCSNTSSTISVTVNNLPIVTANTSTNTICFGGNVTLNGGGATTYTWTNGVINNTAFTPTVTNTYTASGTDVNGCINTAVATVIVNNLPIVTANTSTNTICLGNNVTLNGGGATTYTWTNGVINNTAFTPTSTNTYTVSGTDNNGCINTSVTTVTVNNLPIVTATTSTNTICFGNNVILNGGGATTYTWTNGVTNNAAFTPTSTNTYTVSGTDNNGCINTAITTVTVNNLPTVTANTSTNTICIGNNVILNGAGATTYTWTNGVTNNTAFTPTSTNTYTVSGTDNNGCKNSAVITINVNNLPTVTATANPASVCNGSSTILTGNGANTYTWSSGITNGISFTPSSTNSYTVTGTDGNGCKNISVTTVTVNTLPNVVANASSNEICAGSNVTLYGSGAISYTWSSGVINNAPFIPGATNTYTVTGTNGIGCTNTSVTTITVDPLPTATTGGNQTICKGQSVLIGGLSNANYSYSWSPASGLSSSTNSNPAAHPVSTTAYTLNVTDFVTGCANTGSVTVFVNQLPVVTANTNTNTICLGNNITLSGGGATTYTWTNGVSDGVSFTPSSTNTYTVTGADNNGCTNTAVTTVTVNNLPIVTANTSTICLGNNVTLNGSGATTYTWTNGVTNNTAFTPTSTNTYTVIGTDNNGCINTAIATVTVNNLPTVTATTSTNTICFGNNVTLNGGGATAYTWTNGVTNNTVFTPTSTNTYTVIGADNNGCKNSAVITVTVNSLPVVIATANPASVCIGGSTTLTGSGASTYTWSSGITNGISFTPTSTNSYTVNGTDGNGCTNTTTVSVTVNNLPTISVNSSTICIGNSANLVASGVNTYTWSTGAHTPTLIISPIINTTYTVTGTDINNCTNTSTVNVVVNSLPSITVNTATVCAGSNATLNANGANTYTWSTGATDSIINAQPTINTNYTVSGTDVNNCTNYAIANVFVNALPTISITGNSIICIGQSSTLTASGAVSYTWSTGVNTSSITVNPVSNTSYVVNGVDTNNCLNTVSQNIFVNPLPNINISGGASVCVGSSKTLAASGANTYAWSNGANTASITISPSTNISYTVTGTDINSCTNTATQNIQVNSLPAINIIGTSTVCSAQSTILTASGATTYIWSNGISTAINTISPTINTTYTVIGIDTNNCSNTATQIVNVFALPNVLINQGVNSITITKGSSVTLNVSGANSYQWNTTNVSCTTCTLLTESPDITTQYCVSGTDSIGCTNNTCINIIVDEICGDVFIPDAFSPNGDGANDLFKVYGKCISDLSLQIFDRWGNKIFESSDSSVGWDGSYQGSLMNTGTYIYQAAYTLHSGEKDKKKGNFSLIR